MSARVEGSLFERRLNGYSPQDIAQVALVLDVLKVSLDQALVEASMLGRPEGVELFLAYKRGIEPDRFEEERKSFVTLLASAYERRGRLAGGDTLRSGDNDVQEIDDNQMAQQLRREAGLPDSK